MKVNELIEGFKDCYSQLSIGNIADFSLFYHEEIHFKDPLIELRGLRKVQNYMAERLSNVRDLAFSFKTTSRTQTHAMLTWTLRLRDPLLNWGRVITIEGSTHLEWADRILYQRNEYELGSLVYEQLPIAGVVIKMIKRFSHGSNR